MTSKKGKKIFPQNLQNKMWIIRYINSKLNDDLFLGPKRADLNAMLDNLESSGPSYASDGTITVVFEVGFLSFNHVLFLNADSLMMPKEDEESSLGLGELAELNSYSAINNDSEAAYDVRLKRFPS